MKALCFAVLIFVLSLSTALLGDNPSSENAINKLSPVLQKQMQRNEPNLSAVVNLEKQADLSVFKHLLSREKRGRAIYEVLTRTATETQAGIIDWLKQKGIKHRSFHIMNSIALFDINPDELLEIARRPDVKRITSNTKMFGIPGTQMLPDLSREPRGIENSIKETKADQVWKEFNAKGEGIVVADADTGVDFQHPALQKQYRGYSPERIDHAYNWHDAIREQVVGGSKCGYATLQPCDDDGHGTHTTGTVVGDDSDGNQIGMAPGARWIACRNMDAGVGRPSTYIDCFEWFLAPYPFGSDPKKDGVPEKAPHVINNSWGCPKDEQCHDAEILPVLTALKEAGIMVVASAGNDGSSCSTINAPPAMHSEETLSVGAYSHTSGNIAFFSSRGPSTFDGGLGPDIAAPGVSVRSSVPGGSYQSSSGTSMAGPHVVGQVAVLWSLDKSLVGQINDTVDLIRKSAVPQTTTESCGAIAGSQIPNNTWGWGKIDTYKAATMRVGP